MRISPRPASRSGIVNGVQHAGDGEVIPVSEACDGSSIASSRPGSSSPEGELSEPDNQTFNAGATAVENISETRQEEKHMEGRGGGIWQVEWEAESVPGPLSGRAQITSSSEAPRVSQTAISSKSVTLGHQGENSAHAVSSYIPHALSASPHSPLEMNFGHPAFDSHEVAGNDPEISENQYLTDSFSSIDPIFQSLHESVAFPSALVVNQTSIDITYMRPSLRMTTQEFSEAKAIILDLLGWGVPSEYLMSCGLARESIYYAFTELNLRLPSDFDTDGIVPYEPPRDYLVPR